MTFLLLAFLCLSCQDLKKDGQLNEIKELERKRDSISTIFSERETDSTAYIVLQVETVEERLRLNYAMDTLDRELGEKINEYKMIRKHLPLVEKMSDGLKERLREEKKTLHNLKLDVEKDAGDKSKYDEYIALERDKITELDAQFNKMLATREQCFDAYKRLHQEMETFSKNLEKKKE